jgi:hypothetical protein
MTDKNKKVINLAQEKKKKKDTLIQTIKGENGRKIEVHEVTIDDFIERSERNDKNK